MFTFENFISLAGRNWLLCEQRLPHLIQRGIIDNTGCTTVALTRCMVGMTILNQNALCAYQIHIGNYIR